MELKNDEWCYNLKTKKTQLNFLLMLLQSITRTNWFFLHVHMAIASTSCPTFLSSKSNSKLVPLYLFWSFVFYKLQDMSAVVIEGNDAVTGHIISTTIGGKNGEPKRVSTGSSFLIFHSIQSLLYLKIGKSDWLVQLNPFMD